MKIIMRDPRKLKPYKLNAKTHPQKQVDLIAHSIHHFGEDQPIVVDENDVIIKGHGRQLAHIQLGSKKCQVIVRDDLSETEKRAARLADNRSAESPLDRDILKMEIEELSVEMNLDNIGFDKDHLCSLDIDLGLDDMKDKPDDTPPETDKAEELQKSWKTEPGQIWKLGDHRLICGDCTDQETVNRLMDGKKANGIFTSPPYAMQRKESYGGTPTDKYVDWWGSVQNAMKSVIADDGSFFVNIKPHCESGQRVLYVMDLVLAMVRRWGWRFVDELSWTKEGFMGEWKHRFKNAFEPVFHFAMNDEIKWYPEHVMIQSDKALKFKDHDWERRDGSQSLGFKNQKGKGRKPGLARPSNVIFVSVRNIPNISSHSAAFPPPLPEFFIKAYSDKSDIWLDPFCGSGTTIIAAHNEGRIGYGIEMLPKYCAVILQRFSDHAGINPEKIA